MLPMRNALSTGLVIAMVLGALHAHAVMAGNKFPRQAKALQVVDAKGKVVGKYSIAALSGSTTELAYALRRFDGKTVRLPVSENGFTQGLLGNGLFPIAYLYTSEDCTGEAYVPAYDFPRRATIVDNIAYFPREAGQSLTIASATSSFSDNQCRRYPDCLIFSCESNPVYVAPAMAVDLTPLGFVPPFDVR